MTFKLGRRSEALGSVRPAVDFVISGHRRTLAVMASILLCSVVQLLVSGSMVVSDPQSAAG